MIVEKEEGSALIEYRFQPVESKFEADEYRASSIVEKHGLLRAGGGISARSGTLALETW